MKIALVATGGTIGCRKNAEGLIKLNPDATKQIAAIVGADSVVDDVTIHSERITFADLNDMRHAINRALKTMPDGVIVSHGTDTLAFASSYLAYAFCDTKVPIVMCSADLPLNEADSNGFSILNSAKTFLTHAKPGVYVVYKNPGFTPTVHHGARLLPAHLHDHYYYSIGNGCEFNDTGLMHGLNFEIGKHKVLVIIPYVGLDYSVFNLDGYSAVVHSAYHSGMVNTADFNKFAAAHPDISIFMPEGRKKYSNNQFPDNVVQIRGISQTALYVKLLIGLANNVKDLPTFLKKNACGEIVDSY